MNNGSHVSQININQYFINQSQTPNSYNNGPQRRVNHSQDQRYNMDNNYKNTLGMNRSISNGRYSPNNNIGNNRAPLLVDANNMNNNNYNNNINNYNNTIKQQRLATEAWDKTKGPYGVRFDEMEAHAKLGQKQYKDDLEYLMNLKKSRHGDMTQKEWEAYNRKLHYMNDVNNIFIILYFYFYRDMPMVNQIKLIF